MAFFIHLFYLLLFSYISVGLMESKNAVMMEGTRNVRWFLKTFTTEEKVMGGGGVTISGFCNNKG